MNSIFLNRSHKKKLEALLQDDFVMAHIATKAPGLIIPDHLKQDSSVTLKLSFWFKGRLELKDEAAEAELSFSGASFLCVIPYSAIWAVTSFSNDFELWDVEMKEQLTGVMSPGKGGGKLSNSEASQKEDLSLRDSPSSLPKIPSAPKSAKPRGATPKAKPTSLPELSPVDFQIAGDAQSTSTSKTKASLTLTLEEGGAKDTSDESGEKKPAKRPRPLLRRVK